MVGLVDCARVRCGFGEKAREDVLDEGHVDVEGETGGVGGCDEEGEGGKGKVDRFVDEAVVESV